MIYGPQEYKDGHWQLYLATLRYRGQEIDICSTSAKLYNHETLQWQDYQSHLEEYDEKELFGRIARVETIENLITYKSILAREVDLEDIRQLRVRQV